MRPLILFGFLTLFLFNFFPKIWTFSLEILDKIPLLNKILHLIQISLSSLSNTFYKKMVLYLKNYLIAVIEDPELNSKLVDTLKSDLNRILTNQEIHSQVRETIKSNAKIMSSDPEINSYVHEIIQNQLESSDTSQRTRMAIAKLLKNQLESMTKEEWFVKEVKEQITVIVVNTCESVEVKDKLRYLLEKLMSDLIDSGEINKKLNDLITQTINDEELIKGVGSGIRKSVRHAAYGIFWSESKPDSRDKTEKPDKSEKIDSRDKYEKKIENRYENKNENKQEKLERPPPERLKVVIVPKQRSNSMTDSSLKNDILDKSQSNEN